MSSLSKQSRTVEKGELLLALNAAEGRLQFVIGRETGSGSRRDRQAPGSVAVPGLNPVELEVLAAQDWIAVSQGAELLTPALHQALGNLGLEPGHIGRIAVVNGPGSFTGLRLVCVSAAALARGANALQAPLEYLPLLASGVWETGLTDFLPESQTETAVWVMTHARRGLVYLQGFHLLAGPGQSASLPPADTASVTKKPHTSACWKETGFQSIGLSEKISDLLVLEIGAAAAFLLERAEKIEGQQFLLGSGLRKNQEQLSEVLQPILDKLRLLPPLYDLPSVAMLLRQAYTLDYGRNDVSPLYVRASDAEENLPQIAAKLGVDPDYAVQRLENLLRE